MARSSFAVNNAIAVNYPLLLQGRLNTPGALCPVPDIEKGIFSNLLLVDLVLRGNDAHSDLVLFNQKAAIVQTGFKSTDGFHLAGSV